MNLPPPQPPLKSAAELRKEYLSLLNKGLPEQVYQTVIEENTRLVPREFIQNHGIHLNLILRKLSFGRDFISDFFYMSKSSDNWNYIFVEIEQPQSLYFKEGGNEFTGEFLRAMEQVKDWKAWLSKTANAEQFQSQHVGFLKTPQVLNPVKHKFVLVYGRRNEYHNNEARRAKVAAHEDDDFSIMSFDSLCEDLESKRDCFVGARRNGFVQILGDNLVDDGLFRWLEPENLRISDVLKKSAMAKYQPSAFQKKFEKNENSLPVRIEKIRIT
jgi:hypothetical protein